jgi:hypothetical protein
MGNITRATFTQNCPQCHGSGVIRTWSRNISITDKCGACRGTGRQLQPAPQTPRSQIRIDHETGLIHGLPNGPEPLVGPTTGSEYQELKKKEATHKEAMHLLKRQILSTYQCTECKRKWSGKDVRVKWRKTEGVNMETLVCVDRRCDGPVVMIEDAMSLTRPPGGRV